ncbi:MAG: Omp28-related outer membrane protein [Bacteroidetes bacterium]|nr:Omp28-related outer membrane protein [Bacteroidota bacterium]
MKSIYSLLVTLICVILPGFLIAQNIVSTTVGPRNAVLEEFTGINCPNCPDGHARAEALAAAHPGRVVIINVHAGSYANPSAGQPDFRTPYGTAIDAFAGVAAYPSGTMNRIVWPGAYNQAPYFPQNPPNNLAIRRPGWWDTGYPGLGTGEYIILNGGDSPVNIGCVTVWNDVTRELTITVELYYTSGDSVAENKLNVVFTENHVIGYQSGGSNTYDHKHILREMITGQWGESITPTTLGTLITKSYVYTVPATYNIDNCDLSLFVTRGDNKHTHTGVVIPAKNGTTVGIEKQQLNSPGLSVYPNPVCNETQVGLSTPTPGPVRLELFSVAGQLISSYEAVSATEQVRLLNFTGITGGRTLQPGFYLLKMTAGNINRTVKIVVN